MAPRTHGRSNTHTRSTTQHFTMSSSGGAYIPWSKVRETVPAGIETPMCFCDSLCKLMKSRVLGDDFGMRFFMCDNFEYDPPKCYGKDRAKVPQNTITVCHFSI